MTSYTLGSNTHVCAPGIIQWAINGAKFKRDRRMLINVVASTWSIPASAAEQLVLEQVPYIVASDESVQFEVSKQ
jgi:hypothetical protein